MPLKLDSIVQRTPMISGSPHYPSIFRNFASSRIGNAKLLGFFQFAASFFARENVIRLLAHASTDFSAAHNDHVAISSRG